MGNIYLYTILAYLLICVIVGISGSERQIGFFNSFFLSLITTPLIGFIITVLSSKKVQQIQSYGQNPTNESNVKTWVDKNIASENYISELEKLHELKQKGILTQSEFESKKKKILEP